MPVYVVLLRAIGPATHRLMSMQAWRDASAIDGFVRPETFLATGNMVVEAQDTAGGVAARMNRIVQSLGLGANNMAMVRAGEHVQRLVNANPFPEAAVTHPSNVAVSFFASDVPDLTWVPDYPGPEKLAVINNHLVADYGSRISDSPRLPGLIEKRSGTATARNWNTVAGLARRAVARQLEAR